MNPASDTWLPLGFHDWMPAAQAATLGLFTFVQEDIPTITAALLASAGNLSWTFGFPGVFLGIWVGDALLYVLARGLGRPILQRPWARRLFDARAVARSEQWFAERGTWLLISSRFVPGTRLPTCLAAGFLRLSFARFLAVTGVAVAVWTIGLFLLARVVGPELMIWLKRFNAGGWAVLLVVIALAVGIRLTVRLTRKDFRRRISAAFGRVMRWEFWPAWLFYLPVGMNYLRLSLKYRGLTVPTAANPGIFSGGFVGESKMATLRDLQETSPEFTAGAVLLPAAAPESRTSAEHPSQRAGARRLRRFSARRQTRSGFSNALPLFTLKRPERRAPPNTCPAPASVRNVERLALLDSLCCEHRIDYPLILKPDVGQRGVGVKLIRNREQAAAYLEQNPSKLVVQRYAPGPWETGVFYYRRPHERCGRIFAITEKLFPTVTGDGQHTVEELIWRDRRARFVADKYLDRLGARRTEVLAAGVTQRLVEAGNHTQGCVFQDGMYLWSAELEQRIDEISQRLDGFFIGRYDIRYPSADDLRAGHNFQIIELNGAASEATSIYDSRNTLFAAYRTLFRQWELVFAIGADNRYRGCQPTKPALLWRKWRETNALIATYPLAD